LLGLKSLLGRAPDFIRQLLLSIKVFLLNSEYVIIEARQIKDFNHAAKLGHAKDQTIHNQITPA
jgi:hypothetical protein